MREPFYADINNIADYIIRNYDHSCLAFNGKDSGDLRQDCEDFFYYEKLNWCGCGAPEDVKREILKYFTILEWGGLQTHTKATRTTRNVRDIEKRLAWIMCMKIRYY